ncbi:MAG: DNA repair exonuclease [Chloroflexi bacterium]|nr:DNA repair exonuclease [Chloroflexota bacterium]
MTDSFSFIHAADLHLDSPFVGLGDTAPHIGEALQEASFAAFSNVVHACLRHRVDFLLVAGDVFDSRDRSLRAQLAFRDGLKQLSDAGISSFVVHGNHDPLDGWCASIRWPELAHVFPGGSLSARMVTRGESALAAVHGVSYHTQEVRQNLSSWFPAEKRDPYSIGLLHCNVDNNADHASYAPCTRADLCASGMDYWALGHVHTRDVLRDRDPAVVYPGTTQGRHPREPGARGCYLVHVTPPGTTRMTFLATDVVRWENPAVDLTGTETDEQLLDALARTCSELREAAEGRPVVSRITLHGSTPLFSTLSRPGLVSDIVGRLRETEGRASPFVWVDRLEIGVRPVVDVEARRRSPDMLGSALRLVQRYRDQPGGADKLRELLRPVSDVTRGWRLAPEPGDQDLLRWLDLAEARLMDELSGE